MSVTQLDDYTVNNLMSEVNRLTSVVETLGEQAREQANVLQQFRDAVREALSDAADDDSDLFEPFNEILSKLDLPQLTQEFEIEVRFEGSFTQTVSAINADDARDEITASGVVEYIRENQYSVYISDYSSEVQ